MTSVSGNTRSLCRDIMSTRRRLPRLSAAAASTYPMIGSAGPSRFAVAVPTSIPAARTAWVNWENATMTRV
jgi:hypothetical protein